MFKTFRTKLSGYAASVIPLAGLVGWQFDPATVTMLLSKFGVPLGAAQVVSSLAVHYFRNEADLNSARKPVLDEPAPELQPINRLESELAEQIGGDYEHEEDS